MMVTDDREGGQSYFASEFLIKQNEHDNGKHRANMTERELKSKIAVID